MELRLPLEVSPGREATCRAVFGTWGSFPDDARASHCPFVLTSFTGWSSERCPGIGFLPRGDREIGGLRNVEAPTRPRLECRREPGLILRCDRQVGNPFQTKQGSRPSCRDQEGRRGSEEVVPENLGVPLQGDRDAGALCGSHQGCQVPFRPPIPNVDFLELQRDSRVTTGNSGCLLCWPREVQSSIRVAKESWGLLSSDCRANRPHLGLCPEANVPLQGRKGSRGCIPDAPGETGIHLEWKQRTPLCSRVATGISWSSLGGLKGVKPPEAFGERSRDWSLGHTGDEGPPLSMTGESRGCSRAAAPVCAFSRGTTARSVSLSWGAREVGSPCEWRGRARHCSRAMVGCRGPAPADPGYSKERRRRRRSGNHCLIKC